METKQLFPKEPWLAVILSFFLSGVGQIYSKRVLRGCILILIEITLTSLLIWSWITPRCDLLITIGLFLTIVTIRIWNLFDAHECARKTNPQDFETERKQNKDPWLAFFLSGLIPGIGQIYLKKWIWGIIFMITAGLMLILVYKFKLLYIGLWAVFTTFICFHAYISAPVRREKSGKIILIVAIVTLCDHLLAYQQPLFKAYVVESFEIPAPRNAYLVPESHLGPAMKPTLVYSDRILVRKNKGYVPNRGDVVVFKSPEDHKVPFIMRIAAESGETIEIKDKILYINGQKVQWPPIDTFEDTRDTFGINEPYKVPENCFFVLGDNSANSNDSRYIGPVPINDLIGKVYKIYWPFSRRGPIE